MGKITLLVVEPKRKPYEKEIEHTLENLQREVDGDIQAVYPFSDPVAIICNEEGKYNGCELNRCLRGEDGRPYDIIAGTFLVTGLAEYNFASLSPELIEKYKKHYETPERFINVNGSPHGTTHGGSIR